jgi:hypothetical protein
MKYLYYTEASLPTVFLARLSDVLDFILLAVFLFLIFN